MRKLLYAAVSLALTSSVHAAPINVMQSVATGSFTRSVSDTTNNATAQSSPVPKALSFDKFNASAGVLVDVSSGLSFNAGTLRLSASGTLTSGTGPVSFASEGSISASSTLPGMSAFGLVNEQLTNACTDSASCFPAGASNLSGNANLTRTDTAWLSPTSQATSSSLNDYVGTGNVSSTLTVTPTVSLTDEQRISTQTARLEVIGLVGSQSLTYSYLRHANASFASGADTNSFGANGLTRNNGQSFSLFNFGEASTTKLDFIGVECLSGDCSVFDVSVPSFQDLAVGSSVTGNAALTTNVAGNYGATFALSFSDDTGVGATASHLTNTLTLNVQGSVAPVPEPGSWALMSLGLLGLAFLRRKTHRSF